MRRFLKLAGGIVAVLVLVFVGSVGWIWHQVNASVADYDGELAVAGLSAPVTVMRDSLGVVTIRAGNQLDEARALGFVHAQERFFQMDLLRRSAAGELAALFGAVAVGADERRRVHLMRATAERVVAEAPDDYRALLDAYTDGVNAGLTALGAKPPEYLLLRTDPEPWVPADSVLAVAAMFFDLQGGTALHKRNEFVARSILPPAIGDFLYPARTSWDAPLIGTAASPAGVPESGVYDLRALPAELFGPAEDVTEMPAPIGSNNWAVAGAHTATGRGLVANDMHLGLGVPSIWFRASLERGEWRLTGVSLPGTPLIVAGSNGHVAWGFTNSYGDWLDLIVLELHPDNPNLYRTPDGWVAFETVDAPIAVARGDTRDFEVKRTLWGPVMGELHDGRPYVVRWTAHDPAAYTPGFMDLAVATSVAEALAAAQRSGIPAQNFVVADEYGDIAWTIMGRIPARVRGGGVSHSAEGPAWDGWLAPADYPVVYNPSLGRVWTANARVVDGGALDLVGDGGYALGARGRQIRDRLLSVAEATPVDMLAIQLDDEALFLARWRELLLAQLDDVAVGVDPRFGAVRDAVLTWGGHASVDSVGYRLVRGWRSEMIDRMLSALAAEVRAVDGTWRYIGFRSEEWAWPVASTGPAHLLDPQYESWRVFKLAALAALLDELEVVSAPQVSQQRWGGRNTVRVRHPLSRAVPALSNWLDMPAVALPGDSYMPRVQSPTFGASERFAVSPGDEANGYFHMPGGQSGHPRSPFYGAGHEDWATGRPTPFLPGDPVHTLSLVPPVGSASTVALPSGAGAVAPNLAPARDGGAWLSWIEPAANGHALKFAHRATDGAWSETRTIAQGTDWFVNWADFPALAEAADDVLVAHWLQKSGPDVYAYDVMVTRSTDGGATWSAPVRPHADGTRSEHGFVSLSPRGDGSLRAVWLDGREMSGGHDGHGEGMMTLRSRKLGADGAWGAETLLDGSVCDCCQTAAGVTDRGEIVVYRNRTEDEVRDIWVTTRRDGAWTEPRPVHVDGWTIAACPVNGPALAASGDRVAVAWFTGAGNLPRTFVAFSDDGGDSFGPPIRVDDGAAMGRIGLAMLDDGSVLVSWLARAGDDGEVRVRRVHADGATDPFVVAGGSRAARASGFPRMVRTGGTTLVVWTEPGEPGGLRGVALH